MTQMNKPNQKKLWTSLAVLALLGVSGTVGVLSSQRQPDSKPVTKIEQKQKKEKDATNKNTTRKDNKKGKEKKSTDNLVTDTYDQFGIQSKSRGQSSGSSVSSLTPNEIRTVANAIKQQRKEQEQVSVAVPTPTPIPLVPVPEKPKPPSVVPPVVTSKPVITYQEGIVVVKGEAFNPYAYFNVEDSLDPNVSIYVDTSGVDISLVGSQSFVVVATNKFGKTAVAKIPVFVASRPTLSSLSTDIEIPIGTEFQPLTYVSANDEIDGDITEKISVNASSVNMDQEGSYSVQYVVQNSFGISTTLDIPVHVINKAPTISAPNVTHEINQEFDPLTGVSAVAYNGESISASDIKVIENTVNIHTEGEYTVSYQVKDRFGKESEVVKRTVTVDNEAPVIIGAKDLEFPVGTVLTEEMLLENVSATDREDDKQGVATKVKLDQEQFLGINAAVPGVYPLTYIATDSMGKENREEISVRILGEKPVIHGTEDKTIELNELFDPLAGVTVTDKEDGMIPVTKIEVTGAVDTSTEGDYMLSYQVKDSHGQYSKVYTRNITVKSTQVKKEGVAINPLKLPIVEQIVPPEEVEGLNVLIEKTQSVLDSSSNKESFDLTTVDTADSTTVEPSK